MTENKAGKVAVLWRGDPRTRSEATPQNNRYRGVFDALAALGIEAEPAVYDDALADEVRAQLLACDGVLVWSIRFPTDRTGSGSTRCCATSPRRVCGSAPIPM